MSSIPVKTNDKLDLPDNFGSFCFMPKFKHNIETLASLAEKEDWAYNKNNSSSTFPILENYIKYTYKRIAQENKIAYALRDESCCFDTGLVTENQEPIYMVFTKNNLPNSEQYWHFHSFVRKGEFTLTKFSHLPAMAHYFDDTTKLLYDPRKPLTTNIEHIIEDNKDRFPVPFDTMPNFQLQNFIKGAIDSATERVRRNYKIAVPQYHQNKIQLLLPLCLIAPNQADLALVVEDYGEFYRASTCLTLDMAINNARQIAKPDRD
ncbi:MAG: DUF3825 domain-containing protein [Janthinobacterium lividum]